jgi:hypothetical protein
MRKTILSLAMTFMAVIHLRAQDIEVKWSEQFLYDNKLDGYFDYFIGSNKNYVYAKFSNYAFSDRKRNRKIKLLVFDKATMSRVGEAELFGYSKSGDMDDIKYYKTLVLDNVIYVLWKKTTKSVVEIYAQSFDSRLKKINPLKKVYEVNRSKGGTDNLIVLYNNDINNKILFAKEFAITKDDEKLRIEYKLINEDFSVSASNQITLPIIVTKRRRGDRSIDDNICSYELGDDGKIYIQDKVKLADDERKNLKKGEASVYTHYMQLDPEKGGLNEFRLKFPKKNTFNSSSLVTKDGIKIYGFFCDLEKDEKGNDTHGTFYVLLDGKSFTVKDSKFSYFDKKFLDQLYAADKENQKKGKGLFKSKEAKQSDEESIDDNYVIEEAVQDGNDILLFCSIMNNWSRTVCSGTGASRSCTTYYYCTKSNVTVFRISNNGDIVWASNLDRSVTYSRWNVWDVNVVKQNSDYYVVYGSAYQLNAKKKNRRNSKSGKQMTDRLEYAVFNGKSGDYRKAEYQVNKFNTKKKEEKFISADDIEVFDNRMYTSCTRTKMKPGTFISCLCPPVFYSLMYSGNSYKGTGFLGNITPIR